MRRDLARRGGSRAGKLIQLFTVIRTHADLVEADLSRWHGIRYSDRWRRDEYGQRRLTLREIWVRIQHLPDNAALTIYANRHEPRWSRTDILLADVFQALAGQVHPSRPKSPEEIRKDEARERKRSAVEAEFAERNRALESGEIA